MYMNQLIHMNAERLAAGIWRNRHLPSVACCIFPSARLMEAEGLSEEDAVQRIAERIVDDLNNVIETRAVGYDHLVQMLTLPSWGESYTLLLNTLQAAEGEAREALRELLNRTPGSNG